jgi:hypothetical protein
MNKYFNIHRFTNLLKRELYANLKRNLLVIGAMFSIFTIAVFFNFEIGQGIQYEATFQRFHNWIFIAMLYVGGAFITSFSFIELRNKIKAHLYLMTPGSSLEKVLVNLLLTLIGYFLVLTLLYFLFSVAFNWITEVLYDYQFGNLNFRDNDLLDAIQVFLVVHSVFFLGAISFRKYPVIVTPIVVFVLNFAVFGFAKLAEYIIFGDFTFYNQFLVTKVSSIMDIYAKIIIVYILPPVLWFITYLKLNEKEL